MDDQKLELFIENMRSAGHQDEVIARQLLDSGESELFVLNAFGVSHLDELKESPIAEEEIATTTVIPSAVPIGMDVEIPEEPTPQPPKVAQDRHYPRPAPRNTAPQAKPLPPVSSDDEQTYEHHSYEDFMHRIDAHKELEASSNHILPTGSPDVDLKLENALHEEDVKELLDRQTEAARDAPSEPQIADLITEDVTKELNEITMPNQLPRTKSLEPEPTMQDFSQASNFAYFMHSLKNNNWLLLLIVIPLVAILIGLASVVALRILG